MSLKAKIEAVIYASEEPVTLVQLVGLLGDEAQAELDRARSAQQTLSLDEMEAYQTIQPESEAAADEATVKPSSAENQNTHSSEPAHDEETALNGAPKDETEPEAKAAVDAAAVRAEKARMARLRSYFRGLLDQLIAEYTTPERGLEIREIAGGFRFATKPEYHDAVRGFVKTLKPPLKLTMQSLETLAVVAYKQPVTAPEISEIRGVDASGVLGSLMARKLITTAGRKHVIGRPILYKTTREFLLRFGLKDISELPSIEEFEKMAGQFAEQEEMAIESEPSGLPELAEEPGPHRLEPEEDASDAPAGETVSP
jgi:segregation and condensation protein B